MRHLFQSQPPHRFLDVRELVVTRVQLLRQGELALGGREIAELGQRDGQVRVGAKGARVLAQGARVGRAGLAGPA